MSTSDADAPLQAVDEEFGDGGTDVVGRLNRLEQLVEVFQQKAAEADARAEDALERAERAEARVDDLEGTLEDLRGRVDPDPRTREYESMDRPEKVRKLRLELLERAVNSGRAGYRMTYRDVHKHVFKENGSPGHMYQLMRLAAGHEPKNSDARGSSFDGYYFGRNEEDEYVIRVVTAEVSDKGLVHAVNNGEQGEGA